MCSGLDVRGCVEFCDLVKLGGVEPWHEVKLFELECGMERICGGRCYVA